ncbi:MAG TPA: M20/M25/M40 family metallo-hydrolase [Chthoniobacterales bacterium]|jgi:acetylornithine deacetylase/succinyl-diaminopimelate desuccinylase-like protein|nr:M20/M25/M40 family metallo-hydrolase [Chthoniobacterales bacterium]
MKTALVLNSLVVVASLRADPATVANQARAWRITHEKQILGEFAELLSLPNLASDTLNIQRNAESIKALCEKRGLTASLVTIEGAPPVVVADLLAPNAKRTIAFYAHYDGQPVDPAQWKSEPWKPVMRDRDGHDVDWQNAEAIDPEWRLFARSSGDDKVSIIAMLAALDALRDQGVRPAVNLRFFFEGEEEAGSTHLADYLKKLPNGPRPDAWVFCDGPVHQSRRMELVFGARGTIGLELTVYGPIKGLHDGHYGNWVPNPIVRLTHLIDSMRDENGHILIKGFYDDVRAPTAAEKEALTKIPDVEANLRREFQIASTEGTGKSLNELIMLPALNLRGIEAGHVAEHASNQIPTEARASIDFRLVPNETPDSIKQLVERHIVEQGCTIVRDLPDAATREATPKLVKVAWDSGYPASRTPLDLPFSRELATIMTAAGHEPVRLPTAGGSLPIDLFQQGNNVPVIEFPIANHDDNQHAANENIRLQNLWDGIEVFAAFFSGVENLN